MLILLFAVIVYSIDPTVDICTLGQNINMTVPTNSSHYYITQCIVYNCDGQWDAPPNTCNNITFYDNNNNTHIEYTQTCAVQSVNLKINQLQYSDNLCNDGLLTTYIVYRNNIPIATNNGCWSELKYAYYQLFSFNCGNGNECNCVMWLSLDSTNDSIKKISQFIHIFIFFVLLAMY
jgi:hypothetical protein